ncbi:hypothetical protein SPI_05575 [Niveomyces insectorum RCEF 264]|uniref:Uncharacterized protein n=1 Tax=Niveomyces insectorum RCEF 264 TaxID=1081102 RepID=A0A167TCD0_9HYPO|nr:hypothetical protein SPI_05575 [Niveomyces insectorum RCEF 264]
MGIVPEHGVLLKLYEDAAERGEHRSSAFWQVFLQKAFYEEEFIVVCEAPPAEASRRRIDIVVRRYDKDHHNLTSLVFNECKGRYGNRSDAETQAITAAHAAIAKARLAWMYVMTTVGTTFRVGMVWGRKFAIGPIPGVYTRTSYIDANSNEAGELWSAIAHIKNNPPPRIPTEVPSNAPSTMVGSVMHHDDTYTGVWQAEPPESASARRPLGPDAAALSASAYTGGYVTAEGNLYDAEDLQRAAEEAMVAGVTETAASEELEEQPPMSESEMMDALFAPRIRVRARLISQVFGKGLVVFRDENGREIKTKRDDWRKMAANGFEVFRYGNYFTKHF